MLFSRFNDLNRGRPQNARAQHPELLAENTRRPALDALHQPVDAVLRIAADKQMDVVRYFGQNTTWYSHEKRTFLFDLKSAIAYYVPD